VGKNRALRPVLGGSVEVGGKPAMTGNDKHTTFIKMLIWWMVNMAVYGIVLPTLCNLFSYVLDYE